MFLLRPPPHGLDNVQSLEVFFLTDSLNLLQGSGDLLCKAQPGADRGGGKEVRGRQHLDQPQEQEDHAQYYRSGGNFLQKNMQEFNVLS